LLENPSVAFAATAWNKAKLRRLFPLPEGEGQGEYMKARLRRLGR